MNPVEPWSAARPIRNLNPGDLRPRGQMPEWPGLDVADNSVGGPYAAFITLAEGWAALGLWCLDARYLRGLKTVPEMMAVFASPIAPETAEYVIGVAVKIGLGDLDLAEGETLQSLCRALSVVSCYNQQGTDIEFASGMRLCRLHWPAFRAARLAPAELPLPAPSQDPAAAPAQA